MLRLAITALRKMGTLFLSSHLLSDGCCVHIKDVLGVSEMDLAVAKTFEVVSLC
jgi:hypothetical protein